MYHMQDWQPRQPPQPTPIERAIVELLEAMILAVQIGDLEATLDWMLEAFAPYRPGGAIEREVAATRDDGG